MSMNGKQKLMKVVIGELC